jgi:hypothetical protein
VSHIHMENPLSGQLGVAFAQALLDFGAKAFRRY